MATMQHLCLNNELSSEPSWWARDANGIELCRVCDRCEKEKLAKYRLLMNLDKRIYFQELKYFAKEAKRICASKKVPEHMRRAVISHAEQATKRRIRRAEEGRP